MNCGNSLLIKLTMFVFFCTICGCKSLLPEIVATSNPSPTSEPTNAASLNPKSTSVLEKVKVRGKLICGVNGQLPGFSYINSKSEWSGLDVDFCRAIAAAIFGSDRAVEFKQIGIQERFTALQSGEVDILLRNTAWTLSRDTENEIDFAPTTFFDGQGLMVSLSSLATKQQNPKSSSTKSDKLDRSEKLGKLESKQESKAKDTAKDKVLSTTKSEATPTDADLAALKGKKVCVEAGKNEATLKQSFKQLNVEFTTVTALDSDKAYAKYLKNDCVAIAADMSQLGVWRSKMSKPDEHKILDRTFSQEPLSPAVLSNDEHWHDVVSWVIYSTFYAEEIGIDRENYTTFQNTKDPRISSFLGTSEALGIKLGLSPDWTTQVLKSVGNYADIYNRNLKDFGIPRGLNQSWKHGGLLYAMPFR
jgi:general L-amino acid transport system substrate-binding protein